MAGATQSGASFDEMIGGEYRRACDIASDINEHLPLLRELAQESPRVTEFGVRTGLSTRAFLTTQCRLRSYDLEIDPEVKRLVDAAREAGRDAEYVKADVLKLDIDETDLLFIDTWHTGKQLAQELKLHANKTRRYIAMHDTDLFGLNDEVIAVRPRGLAGLPFRLRRSLAKRLVPSPTSPRGALAESLESLAMKRWRQHVVRTMPRGGLLPSVLNFLAENGNEWRVKIHRTNDNGLTVLERAN